MHDIQAVVVDRVGGALGIDRERAGAVGPLRRLDGIDDPAPRRVAPMSHGIVGPSQELGVLIAVDHQGAPARLDDLPADGLDVPPRAETETFCSYI